MKILIFIAIITHEADVSTFVAPTHAGMLDLVAGYVREQLEIRGEPAPSDQGDMIASYFLENESDFLDIQDHEISVPSRDDMIASYFLENEADPLAPATPNS